MLESRLGDQDSGRACPDSAFLLFHPKTSRHLLATQLPCPNRALPEEAPCSPGLSCTEPSAPCLSTLYHSYFLSPCPACCENALQVPVTSSVFFWGGGRPCFPTPVHASCLGSTVSGADVGMGPAPRHLALCSPRRDLWVAVAGPSPRAAGHRDRWPQSRQASSRRDRGTSPLHPLLNKQEFFRYSSLRKTKLFPFSLASGLRCSSTRAIIRRGFASPGRDSG